MKSIDNIEIKLFNQISAIIDKSKADVSATNNSVIIFWKIGNAVNNFFQNKRPIYGKKIIANLSRQLQKTYSNDYEEKNFRRMLQFASKFRDFEKIVTLSQQLSWSHFLVLIPVKNEIAKDFYIQEAIRRSWGVRNLRRAISENLYEKSELTQVLIEEKSKIIESSEWHQNEKTSKADANFSSESIVNKTKILFTKTSIEDEVPNNLGADVVCDFQNFIKAEYLKVKPFDLKNYSLIFSSVNAVKSFFENGFKPNEKILENNFNKIYAIGKKTKKEIRKYGFGTYKLAKDASQLSDFIVEHCPDEKFLHFCGNRALDTLREELRMHNVTYKKEVIYNTNLLYPKISENYDAVVFFSPSGVCSFAKFNSLENIKLFSIGEATEKELKKFTENRVFTSRESNLEDLLKLLLANSK